MQKQKIFLGSSKESLWLAREIEGALAQFGTIQVNSWYQFGSWSPGASTLESLENHLCDNDFAVLVLSADDLTQSRSDPARPSPRDNVVFELGLFMGRLGRDRAFFFCPEGREFKLPSDLFGITAFPYRIEDRDDAQSVISPKCTLIVKQIEKIAQRDRAQGMQMRPTLELKAKFPQDNGRIDDQHYLSTDAISILKVRATINDDEIDALRFYFDPRLNVSKSSWRYSEDERGRYYWAAIPQLQNMKDGGGVFSFDLDHPRTGKHAVEIVALVKNQPRYARKLFLNVH